MKGAVHQWRLTCCLSVHDIHYGSFAPLKGGGVGLVAAVEGQKVVQDLVPHPDAPESIPPARIGLYFFGMAAFS
jgi:hypothetical protein